MKYIWILVSLTFYAFILSLFHHESQVSIGQIKLAVDISTIIGYSATTIGVCIAGYEFRSWKKVKLFEQKIEGFQSLHSSTHSLYAKHGRLVPYLRLLKSNNGVKNPPLTYQKLQSDLTEINKHKDELSHQLATHTTFFDNKPSEIYGNIFPGLNQENIFADRLLDKISLPEGSQILVSEWLLKINTQDTVKEIELWLSTSQKTQDQIVVLNEYVKNSINKMLQ